ncbi:MAG: lipocalin family protein [Lutibacter sp.]
MKKLFLFLSLFLAAVSFNSCTNDDDDDTADEIVGKWRLSQVYLKIGPESENYMPTECEKKTTIEFFENGTYKESDFEFNDDTNTCVALQPINGTWEHLGNAKYDISGIDFSDFDIPGVTVDMETKITFGSNKMLMEFSGTVTYEGVQVAVLIKVTFIDNDDFVPDTIIGKWKMDQQFYNNVEENLSDCEKTMTIQFFDSSAYEEKDFELNEALQCIALETKKGNWRNLGSNMYEISDLGVSEFKVTFTNNKMTIEFTDTEEGETISVKYIFIKVSS